MAENVRRLTSRRAAWLVSLAITIALGLSWLVGQNPRWFRSAAALAPERAPYHEPAPYTELAAGVKQFHLYATDGLHPLPGGGSLYIWGYSTENRPGTAKLPGPTIVVDEGDQVEIVFTNLGMAHPDVAGMAHTIHLHGLDVPEWTDGVLTTVKPGESFTYAFTATKPGTYWYHCHVDTIQHLTMGMYGAVVVRARDGAAQAWTGGPAYDREYTLVLSEADPVIHAAVERGASYDRTHYDPRFFFINGRSFPDVMNHPADLIRGRKGETALVRLINAGYTWKSMHMHGFHFDVIASDGRPLPQPVSKDTLSIGPGERYDLLVRFDRAGTYPFHSHAIVDNLNSGQYPGGIHTLVQVDDAGSPSASHDHGAHAAPNQADLGAVSYLKVGEVRAHVHGRPVLLPARPAAEADIVLAPVQFVAQALGAELTVEGAAAKATLHRSGKSVTLTAGEGRAATDLGERPLPVAPRKVNQSLLVPVQFLAEYFSVPLVPGHAAGELLIGTVSVEPLSASRRLVRAPILPVPSAPPPGSSPAEAPAHAFHGASTGSDAETAPAQRPPAPAAEQEPEATNTQLVVIHAHSFDPLEVRVPVGTRVIWLNQDGVIHAVSDKGSSFRSGDFGDGANWQHTFNEPGTYEYFCNVHPEMTGRIVVTP